MEEQGQLPHHVLIHAQLHLSAAFAVREHARIHQDLQVVRNGGLRQASQPFKISAAAHALPCHLQEDSQAVPVGYCISCFFYGVIHDANIGIFN